MRQSELDRRTFVMGSFGFGMAVLGGGRIPGLRSLGAEDVERIYRMCL